MSSMASILYEWPLQSDTKNHLKKELVTRKKMTLVSQFFAPIKEIVKFGYKSLAPAGSRIGSFQKAQSNLFKNAIHIDEQGAASLNMSLVTIFVGVLPPVNSIEAKRLPDGDFDLTWHIEDYRCMKATLLLFFSRMKCTMKWYKQQYLWLQVTHMSSTCCYKP